jgi:DNA-binding CsgD family transcriptional regulator
LLLHRRLGRLLWDLSERGRSPAQIARDLRLSHEVVETALTLPDQQWAAVEHLHRQGLIAAEIAELLGIPLKAVDRQLRVWADWSTWLECCCPPGWGKKALHEAPDRTSLTRL